MQTQTAKGTAQKCDNDCIRRRAQHWRKICKTTFFAFIIGEDMTLSVLRWLSGLGLFAAGIAAFWPVQRTAVTGALWMDALHLPAAVLLMYWLSLFAGDQHRNADLQQLNTSPSYATRLRCRNQFTAQLASITTLSAKLFWARLWQPTVAVLVLVVIEVIQGMIGRSGQWSDLWHGSLGILLFLSGRHLRWLGRVVLSLICILIASRDLFGYWLYQQQLHFTAPRLMTKPLLSSPFGWQPIAGSSIRQQVDVDGQQRLTVIVRGARYQGLEWRNPQLDFSAVTELCFSAISSQPMTLSLRIDDWKASDYNSRYNSTVAIGPNWQRYCLDISQLRSPSRRTLDKSALTSFYWFSKNSETDLASHSFTLANLTIWPG